MGGHQSNLKACKFWEYQSKSLGYRRLLILIVAVSYYVKKANPLGKDAAEVKNFSLSSSGKNKNNEI